MAKADKSKIYPLAGVFGGIAFGGAFFLGSGLAASTGLPLTAPMVNGFWVAMVISATIYILRDYHFISTAMMFIYGIAATFTMLLGPPGWYKIIAAIFMGLSWDFIAWKYKNLVTQIIGAVIFMAVGIGFVVLSLFLQKSPALDKMIPLLPIMITVSIVSAVIGVLIGHPLGKRIDSLPIISRILGRD